MDNENEDISVDNRTSYVLTRLSLFEDIISYPFGVFYNHVSVLKVPLGVGILIYYDKSFDASWWEHQRVGIFFMCLE